jgi:hypothetical protein
VNDFEYGPAARGIFVALLWFTLLLAWVAPNLLPWHVGLLLFLGLGLKPLLRHTGAHRGWHHLLVRLEELRYAKSDADNIRRIERKRRDDKLRAARKLPSELPPRW